MSADGPDVKMIEQGEEPRVLLRFTPQANDVRHVRVRFQSTSHQVVEGREKPPSPAPLFNFVLQLNVKDVDAATGVITIECECVEAAIDAGPGTPADLAKRATDALQSMVGSLADFKVDARGTISAYRYDKPERFTLLTTELSRAINASIGLLFPNLPEDPIGRGGSWSSSSVPKSAGALVFHQLVTYTVTELTPTRVAFDIDIEQRGGKQVQRTGGSHMNINSFAGEGQGKTALDLAIGMPERITLAQKQVTDMTVADAGIPVHDTLEKTFEIELIEWTATPGAR